VSFQPRVANGYVCRRELTERLPPVVMTLILAVTVKSGTSSIGKSPPIFKKQSDRQAILVEY
jgi:hypothetical protein